MDLAQESPQPLRSDVPIAKSTTSITTEEADQMWEALGRLTLSNGSLVSGLANLQQRLSLLERSSNADSLKRSHCVCSPRFPIRPGLPEMPETVRWSDDV